MKDLTKRTLCKAVVCGFMLTAVIGWFPFGAVCGSLSQDVLRLHVVANSDSEEDQAVKIKVRDAVLEEAEKWTVKSDSMEQASAALCVHLGGIQRAAQRALEEGGFPEKVVVEMTDMYFPTRDYEGFSLPAGKYRTLRISIGRGEGKNWWCVVFPALCLPAAAGEDVLSALPDSERELVEHSQKYRVKLKAVEWYEKLCQWLEG